MSRSYLCLTLLLLVGPGLSAQTEVRTEPALPIRGTLFRLQVTTGDSIPVGSMSGTAGVEPLHLHSIDGVTWLGLAAAPIDLADSLFPVTLLIVRGTRTDTISTTIPVGSGHYPAERLRVAPSMAEPDSAAQARISREGARAKAVGRAAHGTERLWQEPFEPPRVARITSGYGTARMYNGTVTSRHLGTDFAGAVGDPVRATNRGRVALVADFYLAGRVIYLDHGEGLVSAYFHLSRTRVEVGEIVERGQLIGNVGRSGRVTGPHLHWVMRYGRTTIDPMSVLPLLGDPQTASPLPHSP